MHWKEFLLMVATIVLTLIAGEAALRFANYPVPRSYGWGPGWAPSVTPTEPKSDNVAAKDSKIRILLVGDSQVGSRSDPQDPLPAKLLEMALNSRTSLLGEEGELCGTLPALR